MLFHAEWKDPRAQGSVVLPRNEIKSSSAELANMVASSHRGYLHLDQLKLNRNQNSISQSHWSHFNGPMRLVAAV